jgi:hypothetical protein
MKLHGPKFGGDITIRPPIFIDGNTCKEDDSRKAHRGFSVVPTENHPPRPIHFLKRLLLLCVCALALGLICSEIPESLSLCEDTSNDFVEFNPAPALDCAQTVRKETSFRREKARPLFTFLGFQITDCDESSPFSSPNLMKLLLVQRK